jgi:lincosamide nucleotidyltransferase A/C/D/E
VLNEPATGAPGPDRPITGAAEVREVLEALRAAGCRTWVAGGWGVDVLLGHQTRAHRDLDLAIESSGLKPGLDALEALGYLVETNWLPVRVELHRQGRGRVDLHPVVFDERGDGLQAGFEGSVFHYPKDGLVHGHLDGVEVACLSRELQLEFRRGYELRDVDRHDLALLRSLG